MRALDDRSERRHFEAALLLEGQAREAYLLEIGAGQADLERRVRALLAAHERETPGMAIGGHYDD
jgi:hypothetical protein